MSLLEADKAHYVVEVLRTFDERAGTACTPAFDGRSEANTLPYRRSRPT